MAHIISTLVLSALSAPSSVSLTHSGYSNDTRDVSFDAKVKVIQATMMNHVDKSEWPTSTEPRASTRKRIAASCPLLRTPPPTSDVTDLHPCNIEAIASIGDSITTADNARSDNWLNLRQYPGLAWSQGGDVGVETLPNFWNQSCSTPLIGPSIGSGLGKRLNLNRAVSGSVVQNLPDQAEDVRNELESTLGERYPTAWKHVSVLMGGNNLCIVCQEKDEPENNERIYEEYLRKAMIELMEIPYSVISIVQHLDYTQLAPLVNQLGCMLIMPSVCPCLGVDNEDRLEISRQFIKKYNTVIEDLVDEFNKIAEGQRRTMRFVVQPFAIETDLADPDLISRADCFHPSANGQELVARGIWTNMFQPVGQKQSKIEWGDLACPGENSRVQV